MRKYTPSKSEARDMLATFKARNSVPPAMRPAMRESVRRYVRNMRLDRAACAALNSGSA